MKQQAVQHWEAVEGLKPAECCQGAFEEFAKLGTELVKGAGSSYEAAVVLKEAWFWDKGNHLDNLRDQENWTRR